MAQQAQLADKQADRDFTAQQNQLDRDSKMDIEEKKISSKVVKQAMNKYKIKVDKPIPTKV